MSIPPDEFLDIHSRLKSPIEMSKFEVRRFYGQSVMLYGLACHLHSETLKAGWDEEFADAIHSGTDRLSLSILNWLQHKSSSEAQFVTLGWLATIPGGIASTIHEEVEGITERNDDTSIVTDSAEAELNEYPAFVALGSNIEALLFERELSMKEASTERLGVALGGLALKRQLAKQDVDELEAQFLL